MRNQVLWYHGGKGRDTVATDDDEKTAGKSVALTTRRRPSWELSMYAIAREGISPYDCRRIDGQATAVFWGGS